MNFIIFLVALALAWLAYNYYGTLMAAAIAFAAAFLVLPLVLDQFSILTPSANTGTATDATAGCSCNS